MHFGHLLFPFQYPIDLDDPVISKSVKTYVILRLATLLISSEKTKVGKLTTNWLLVSFKFLA